MARFPTFIVTFIATLLIIALLGISSLFAIENQQGLKNTANAAPQIATQQASSEISHVQGKALPIQIFIDLIKTRDSQKLDSILQEISDNWQTDYTVFLLESWIYAPSYDAYEKIYRLLKQKTGQDFGEQANQWFRWVWQQPEMDYPGYDNFKAALYKNIDPKFETYFKDRQNTKRIRLEEIRWGGVLQDGIPPLRNPKMITAQNATYLQDDNIVFGIEINGDARAYPKRILAWHEMFTDTIGGIDIAGVYCTLCGTVIPYKTELNGEKYKLGTSGFLYRSNKLMYDAATQSLWNTIKGEPVLGPLAGQQIALEHLSVVTTSWAEWKRRHPKTSVLSLKTGHDRNYGEGVAYNAYFATDRLMFNTPFTDRRLKNKQEVLALRFAGAPTQQLAIDTDFLNQNPLYAGAIGSQKFIVITDKTGANRVYDPQDTVFTSYDGDATLRDDQGTIWTLTESTLKAPNQADLTRLPYHRAFWFGWHATYPDTKLISAQSNN